MRQQTSWFLVIGALFFSASQITSADTINDLRTGFLKSQYNQKLSIPVTWQMTKTKFSEKVALTQTESFSEKWSLEWNVTGELVLKSPRYTATVITGASGRKDRSFPSSVVISEVDLIHILGLQAAVDLDLMIPKLANRTFSIPLEQYLTGSKQDDSSRKWTITVSEEEHYSFQFDFNA